MWSTTLACYVPTDFHCCSSVQHQHQSFAWLIDLSKTVSILASLTLALTVAMLLISSSVIPNCVLIIPNRYSLFTVLGSGPSDFDIASVYKPESFALIYFIFFFL